MREMTIDHITNACRGEYRGSALLHDKEVRFITTDSRAAGQDCLFIAIKGEKFDGHDFMRTAVEQGALCCVAEKAPESLNVPYILVDSTLAAARDIAAYYRSRFNIPFIGITGSVGKTTFKEIISSVLSTKYRVLKTPGNFNNEIGVPLSVFGLKDFHEAAVLEMGISDFGEMSRLGAIVRPDMAVFSAIGDSHLEYLGSREGVLKAKSEMLDYMPDSGVVFVNGDDELLNGIECKQEKISFGIGKKCDVRAENINNRGLDGIGLDIMALNRRIPVKINAYGNHMITAALAAASVAMKMGLTDEEIISGINAYHSADRRSSVITSGRCRIIDDCYNANPTSVESSLMSLKSITTRKVCILGDMLELGKDSSELHKKIGRIASQMGLDLIICCGSLAEDIHKGIVDSQGDNSTVYFARKDELAVALNDLIQQGDTVLVKASRGMKFEEIVNTLKKL